MADYSSTGTPTSATPTLPLAIDLTYYYTSQAEISRIVSTDAADAFTDDIDDSTSESELWDEIRAEATDMVNYYLAAWYDESDMVANSWIRRQATWLGCFLLSQRRGDPGKYHARSEQIIDMLERISTGRKQVPRLPQKADLTPSLSNYRVDDRFYIAKIRVQPTISSGGTSGRQHMDPMFPCEWFR